VEKDVRRYGNCWSAFADLIIKYQTLSYTVRTSNETLKHYCSSEHSL